MWKNNFRLALSPLKNKRSMAFPKITLENGFSPFLVDKSTVSSINMCITVITHDNSETEGKRFSCISVPWKGTTGHIWSVILASQNHRCFATVFSRTVVWAVMLVTVHSYWAQALPLTVSTGRSLGLVYVIHWNIACFHLGLVWFFFS